MEQDKNKETQTIFQEENIDGPTDAEKTSTGLDQNIAGMLCYLAGFITGIIFLFIEKDNKFVRYHAIQSIIVSVTLVILNLILTAIPIFGWMIGLILAPIYLVLWIYMLFKAYQGKRFKLPIAGDMAEKQLDNMSKNN